MMAEVVYRCDGDAMYIDPNGQREAHNREVLREVVQLHLVNVGAESTPGTPPPQVGILPEESATRLESIRKYGPGILLGLFFAIALIPGATGIISGPALWLLEVLLGL